MLTKAGHTSWEGISAKGAPMYTIVRGTIVMRDGQVDGQPGFGLFVPGTAAAGKRHDIPDVGIVMTA